MEINNTKKLSVLETYGKVHLVERIFREHEAYIKRNYGGFTFITVGCGGSFDEAISDLYITLMNNMIAIIEHKKQ